MKEPSMDKVIERLKKIAGIKIHSVTMYPGKEAVKANITIEVKGKHEGYDEKDMRRV